MKKVNVILAAYNGGRHIVKQLDSIVEQTYPEIDIYIRDDGSTDDTMEIIQNYIKEYKGNRNIIFLETKEKHLRCPECFYYLARNCEEADYYAFSDQDDYWYPQKIEWAVELLERESDDKPLVYCCSCDYRTEDGEFIRRFPVQPDTITMKNVLYYTPSPGFTLVFNEQARRRFIMESNPGSELHDKWMLRNAACFGKVIYDSRIGAQHIRHEEAVTSEDAGNKNLLIHFIKNELMGTAELEVKRGLQYFYEEKKELLSGEDKQILQIFIKEKCGFTGWLKKVCYPHRLRPRLVGEVAIRILFLLGRL